MKITFYFSEYDGQDVPQIEHMTEHTTIRIDHNQLQVFALMQAGPPDVILAPTNDQRYLSALNMCGRAIIALDRPTDGELFELVQDAYIELEASNYIALILTTET